VLLLEKIVHKRQQNILPCHIRTWRKNPCIIDETANLKLAAKRIVWGFVNAGQTCIPDYILIQKT
jgi:aldehyde dehydrogenase (NAD+)